MEFLQRPGPGKALSELQRQAEEGRTGMFPLNRCPLRHIHAGRSQRARPDDIRSDEPVPGAQLLPAHLVQEGGAQEHRVGCRAARLLAHG